MPKNNLFIRKINQFLIFFALMGSFILTASCKKGENDPFFSLRSRKARLTNQWHLKSGTETIHSLGLQLQVKYSETVKSINDSAYSYSEIIEFKKNGEYTWTITTNNSTLTEEGYWEFGRKNKELDYKSKEIVYLIAQSITSSGAQFSETNVYSGTMIPIAGSYEMKYLVIDELRHNKMVIVAKGEVSYDGEVFSYEMEKVFK